jgi:hypothetical protein
MKKFIAILLLTLTAGTALAQHHGHGGHGFRHGGGHYRGGGNWVAPAIIGGIIGYGLSRPYYDPYYAQPPVYVQPAPVYVQPQPMVQQCTRYIYQDQYGQTVREETRCN